MCAYSTNHTKAEYRGYQSFGPIEKIFYGCWDLSVREKDWRGKPGLLAHAQHTEPYVQNLGTQQNVHALKGLALPRASHSSAWLLVFYGYDSSPPFCARCYHSSQNKYFHHTEARARAHNKTKQHSTTSAHTSNVLNVYIFPLVLATLSSK